MIFWIFTARFALERMTRIARAASSMISHKIAVASSIPAMIECVCRTFKSSVRRRLRCGCGDFRAILLPSHIPYNTANGGKRFSPEKN